jgi:hypothetical protein
MRGIDNIKKTRGESTVNANSLRMKGGQEAKAGAAAPPPVPLTLKLK